jgi:chloramphenicol-sensitive protein RarD
MSRLRLAGVALATLALVVQAAALGHIPWISPALALSFGFYGIFRKQAVVTAMDGLLVETALLFPVTLGLVIWWGLKGSGVFPSTNLLRDALLICGGPLTAIPLAMFAAGARRVRLTTLGFLQYLAPSITLLLAVFAFHERFTPVNAVVFGCVWSALGIVALERRFTRFRQAAASSGH